MEILEVVSFLLLSIVAIVSFAYKRDNLTGILHLLLFASVTLLIRKDLSEDPLATQISYGLIGVVALNLVLSKWSSYHRKYLRVIPPFLTFIAFWIFLGEGKLSYLDSTFDIGSTGVRILPFIGLLGYEIAYAKNRVIKSFFDTDDSLIGILLLFIYGIAILIAAFNALGFGVLLVSAGYLGASFYRSKDNKQLIYSLLGIALIWKFSSVAEGIASDLHVGKTLLGLFVGAFSMGLIQFSWTAKKRRILLVVLSYMLVVAFVVGALLMQLQHNSFGGMETLIGVLVGFSLANAIVGKRIIGMSILSLVVAIGLYFPSFLINEEQLAIEEELEIFTAPDGEDIIIERLPLNEVIGKYKIETESSLISFELGPEGGVTKGAIRSFSGRIEVKDDILASTFNIQMPISTLTTFNQMRDDAIMAPEYFNSDKFDKMTFVASSLKATNLENEYDLTGRFTLLGVTKELTIRIMRLDEKDAFVLVGNGSLNRTLFGMTADSRQGNDVSFEFKVKLVK